jgi:excisionase family DNA binding protein
MASDPITLQQAADELGVHYMTAYRYVRTGRLPAVRHGGTWQVERADLGLVGPVQRGGQAAAERVGGKGLARLAGRLETRLLAGDEAGAWKLIENALVAGTTPAGLLLGAICPAMVAIGTRWERGEATVADEHRASATATRLVSRLGALFGPRGRKRGTVVLCTPAGDQHSLPVAIAADLLRWRGFEVVELGADAPADAVGETCARIPDLLAVGLGATMPASTPVVRRSITTLRRALPGVALLLGGAGIADADEARRLGADVYSGRHAGELLVAVEGLAPPAGR